MMTIEQLIKEVSDNIEAGLLVVPELLPPVPDVPVEVVKTGSKELDEALGVGGLPVGRIVEILGEHGCLDRNTRINFIVWDDNGKIINSKGGSIEYLYRRFNGLNKHSRIRHDSIITVPSFDKENKIFHNKIHSVVSTGRKECYELTTSLGNKIIATKDHKFFDGYKFIPLSKLVVTDSILIHNNTYSSERRTDKNRTNDSIENLLLLSGVEHNRSHSKLDFKGLRFKLTKAEIVSIESVGERETYDIKCIAPYNNYIANKFAVHNSGKTTLASHVIANAQEAGEKCAYIDVEYAFDKKRAETLGVQFDKLAIAQPKTAEDALQLLDTLIVSGIFKVIVLDSVAALIPKAELEGEMSDSVIGLQARLMGKCMRKIVGTTSKNKVLVIFVNQLRDKIGGFGPMIKVGSGGNALKFYSSVRLDLRRTKNEKRGETLVHTHHKITITKNKLGIPFKTVSVKIGESGFVNESK